MTSAPTVAEPLIERHRFTRADYHSMADAGILAADERVELIEGAIVDMAPIGSQHVATVDILTAALTAAIGDRAIVSVQAPIALSDFSEPEPDLAVYRYRDDFYADRSRGPDDALLLVEVSESSLRYDLEVKLPLYARHGVRDVWLVDLGSRRLVWFTHPGRDGYQAQRPLADLAAVPLPGLGSTVNLNRLF